MPSSSPKQSGGGSDRGSAEAVGTILALATLLVFAGLTIPALDIVTNTATIGQQRQLEFHAHRLSGEIQSVDRLVRSSASTGPIGRSVGFPDHIGNEQYIVSIRSHPVDGQTIELRSSSGSVSARVQFISETPVANATIRGGDLRILREIGSRAITVRAEGAL